MKNVAICTNPTCTKKHLAATSDRYKELKQKVKDLRDVRHLCKTKEEKKIHDKKALAAARKLECFVQAHCTNNGVAKDVPIYTIDCPTCGWALLWKVELTKSEKKRKELNRWIKIGYREGWDV